MMSTLAASRLSTQFRRELRQYLEEIADETVVGNLEDMRFGILVDGDDDLAVLHPGEMLDRARNTDRDIQIGRDDLARLPDLIIIGHIARIDRGARGADRGVELRRQIFDQLEIVAAAHAAAARNN